MKPERWQQLDEIFHRALELPGEDRPRYLDQACGDDEGLRAEVEAVLKAHRDLGGTGNPDLLVTGFPQPQPPGALAGTPIGVYRLDTLIGHGGMGEVYRADRVDGQFDQHVAIKLVRPGRDADALLHRFRLERQILARLEHPNIATLLDGGVTAAGQPYLVMQYVDGVPITEYVRAQDLDLLGRLELFRRVCQAVHFAHTNLVVHRDLKPSNILVTKTGEVRLLDFGIAKLLAAGEADRAPATTDELLLLTPEHAAPEQFLGGPITTATDCYALGVLLYELLVGFRPFQHLTADQLPRAVCEQEPIAPSKAARQRDGPVPASRLAGDLDSIVLRALQKEPARRYVSVADLSDDVARHLRGLPVRARPETLRYLATRFVRRHAVGVIAAGTVGAALVALAIVSVRSATTSRAQAAAIARERDVAVAASSFLERAFAAPDPYASGAERRDTLRIRDFLDEATVRVERDLAYQPALEARLLAALGKAHRNLGRLEQGRAALGNALAIRRRGGSSTREVAESELDLGLVLLDLGEAARAESLFRSSAAGLAPDSVSAGGQLSQALAGLGTSLQEQGRLAPAESVYRRALRVGEAATADSTVRVADHLANLGTNLAQQGKLEEAEPLLRRALSLQRARLGDQHPIVASALDNLGNLLSDRHQFDEAERALREALAIRRTRFLAPHPQIALSLNNVAALLFDRGSYEAAIPVFRETLAMRRALYGGKHPAVGVALLNLGNSLGRFGRHEEAMAAYREAQPILLAALGLQHPTVGALYSGMSAVAHNRGDHRGALGHLEATLAIYQAKLGPGAWNIGSVLSDMGRCLTELGRYQDAERRLLEARAILEPQRTDQPQRWDRLLERLATLYRLMGRPGDAERTNAERTDSAKTGA